MSRINYVPDVASNLQLVDYLWKNFLYHDLNINLHQSFFTPGTISTWNSRRDILPEQAFIREVLVIWINFKIQIILEATLGQDLQQRNTYEIFSKGSLITQYLENC